MADPPPAASPGPAGLQAAIGELLRIRPLDDPDVGAVLDLWGCYVSEGFIDNFPDQDAAAGDLVEEHLSLDRWGPGIAMPMLPGAPAPHMPKEPSYAVARQLTAMVGHPLCRCLVAEVAAVIVGFVTYSIRPLATMDERVASIEDLFIDPAARRAGIGTALLRSAVDDLRREHVGVFHALAPVSQRYAGARALFASLGWQQDLAAFSLYD
ncbi:MAG: GNAT family N-acetyltransferase [Streptosporangiaceae bacterium]